MSPEIGDYLTFDETTAQQAYSRFMTPTLPEARDDDAAKPPARGKKKRTHKKPPPPTVPAGLRVDPGDGKSQAGQLGRSGLPVYYPEYIPMTRSTASRSPGTASCTRTRRVSMRTHIRAAT